VKRLFALALLLLPLALTGCVERILEIRSDPPGADVYIDGERMGVTPLVHKYAWYGTREVTLIKPDHRTDRQLVVLNAPWWQIFPFDLITDVALPFTVTDKVEHVVVLSREPADAGGLSETLERANRAREKASLPVDAPR